VIIPVLNGSGTIAAAVQSALDQKAVQTHVIVVDAGSTDDTVQTVQALRSDRVHLVQGRGPLLAGAARNQGIALARSPWISFLDADDLWPAKRSIQLLRAITRPDQQLAVGRAVAFSEAGLSPGTGPCTPCSGNLLMARSLLERVGWFNTSLRVGEVVDWMARCRRAGIEEVPVPVVALWRRHHSGNTSRERQADYAASVLEILRQHRGGGY
jgi:glycosyltransferase involved in cell wall biosynthesis